MEELSDLTEGEAVLEAEFVDFEWIKGQRGLFKSFFSGLSVHVRFCVPAHLTYIGCEGSGAGEFFSTVNRQYVPPYKGGDID